MSNQNRGVSVSLPKDEWHTPTEYIRLVKQLYNQTIDLDPASNAIANLTVGATTYYDQQTNGLTKTWAGNVWLNPPYSRTLIGDFTAKVINERSNYNQLVMLINSNTETVYSQKLLNACDAVCFTNHRIKFIDPTNVKADSPVKGNAFYYFGNNTADFKLIFSTIGIIMSSL